MEWKHMNLELNDAERRDKVLRTVSEMLHDRQLGGAMSAQDIHRELARSLKNDVATVALPGSSWAVRFVNRKISSLRKFPEVDGLVSAYPDHRKILVLADVSSISMRDKDIEDRYELFLMSELLENVARHCLQPEFSLLSEEDKARWAEEDMPKLAAMMKIDVEDPVSRYYYAKEGDVFRIRRPSSTSMYEIAYRVVERGVFKK